MLDRAVLAFNRGDRVTTTALAGQAATAVKAREVAAIKARADEEHQWVMQRDDRGVFEQYPNAL